MGMFVAVEGVCDTPLLFTILYNNVRVHYLPLSNGERDFS